MWRRSVLLLALVAVLASCGELEEAETPSLPAMELGQIDDPDCDEATIGDDGGTLVGAFAVADGEIEGVCAGEPDERLDEAWAELLAIVPAQELGALDVFAGFDDPESDVQAFVTPLGEVGNDRFGMSVNLSVVDQDPDSLRLTLAHEMSHVFSQTPDQLDAGVDPADCPTFHNGNGCFLEGSLVLDWIDRFWTDEQLASIPDPTEADEAGGERRCSLDPGFLGSYAASSPEEDFAESFSAFVFGLDVPAEVQPRLDFFAERPEFQAYRDQVLADGRERPENIFDECGV